MEGVAEDLIVVEAVIETVGEGEEIGAGFARIVTLFSAATARKVLMIACECMTVEGS